MVGVFSGKQVCSRWVSAWWGVGVVRNGVYGE